MSSDFSRITFDPWKDLSGVLMQQGRVQLDSDWNEWLAEIVRRVRAGTLDTLGHAVYPATTPNGFLITPTANSISIGVGRMYVDGLLVENHGTPAPGSGGWIPNPAAAGVPNPLPLWDPYLDELVGQNAVDYLQQPYFPGIATQAPFPTSGGPFLVYLDVWLRELTFLEDPDLVEKAVGVDSTGRWQTVWQVRLLDVSSAGAVTCSTPDSGISPWQNLIQPSAGRLTTGVVQSSSSGPCCLAPNTGFTGMENQLYRIEIHHPPGVVATAPLGTFKWSRDNASVATSVLGVQQSGTVLSVQSTGKDSVLRFNNNDWVEITDDWLELNGQPGELHQIKLVSDAAKTITLYTTVSAANFPVDAKGNTDPTRHTRLTRWDQAGKIYESDGTTVWTDLGLAGATGDIPIPPSGTSLILENGITVSFDLDPNAKPSPGQFDTADYWTFAARTADGTIEYLVEAPPRGIHHHYARLAMLPLPGPASDCRVEWPPAATTATGSGCCTVSVKPEDVSGGTTLQSIIDQYAGQDEITICLQPGTYALPAPLRLGPQHSNLTLEGCHKGVFFTAASGSEEKFLDGLVVVIQANHVTLSGLGFILPAVLLARSGGSLADVRPDILARAGGPTVVTLERLFVSVGVRAVNATALTVRECDFEFPLRDAAVAERNTFTAGILGSGSNNDLTLEDNVFAGQDGTTVQIEAEPFHLSMGYVLAPRSGYKNLVLKEGVLELSANFLRATLTSATIRGNTFTGLTNAVFIYADAGDLNVADNSASECYTGFWILGRHHYGNPNVGDSETDKKILQDILLDPVLVLGSAIARAYPLPLGTGGGRVISGRPKLGANPFKSQPLMGFYVLTEAEVAVETAASGGVNAATLSLQCVNNRVDALATAGPGNDSGEALVVWGEDANFETDVVLNANRIRNNATPVLSAVAIVSMSRCSINGNVLLNTCPTSPGWCLYILLTSGESNLSAGMAVTGNVLQTNTNVPANWLPMNAIV